MPVPHCMFSAGRCAFWAGAESDFCGKNGRWKGLIFRHNRVFVQNQGAVLKKSSLRGVHPGDFPSRQGENERRPISCAHSSWIKRSTLLCRKMTRVHPVVSFPQKKKSGSAPPPRAARSEKIKIKITRRIHVSRRYASRRYTDGLGPSRVRTRIPTTRRLGQWVSLRKTLRFRVRLQLSQSRCLSLLLAMSGRVFLFFPPRGHENPPTLRDRLNPDLGL